MILVNLNVSQIIYLFKKIILVDILNIQQLMGIKSSFIVELCQ